MPHPYTVDDLVRDFFARFEAQPINDHTRDWLHDRVAELAPELVEQTKDNPEAQLRAVADRMGLSETCRRLGITPLSRPPFEEFVPFWDVTFIPTFDDSAPLVVGINGAPSTTIGRALQAVLNIRPLTVGAFREKANAWQAAAGAPPETIPVRTSALLQQIRDDDALTWRMFTVILEVLGYELTTLDLVLRPVTPGAVPKPIEVNAMIATEISRF